MRRIGTKGRPFYRVVVAKSTAGRNGAFVETIGQYDPVVKPTLINIDKERALHWLLSGAQPTETTAILLNKIGVLEEFFKQRPASKKDYKFLDKRTAAMSVKSAIEAPAAVAEAPAPAPAAKEEPVAEPEPAPAEEAPVAEEPVAEPEAVKAEEPAAEPTVESEEG
ncbi:MAG TPA: 30S ribosomal protein S16 [Fimbriimonadaceae bacterium]|nr:30S ribosomal protein S16 [Fimbriimonadaceae bacterium]